MKKIFSAVLHELEHEKIKIKKVKKMRKVCPDPPPVKKILNFFFSNEPFPKTFLWWKMIMVGKENFFYKVMFIVFIIIITT